MGKPKNKKVHTKQKASNKSNCKSSSAQKENMPKNEKRRTSMKPNPNDGIAMSKQLLLKKKSARTQRRSSTKPERICRNGKPIPSLAELEKMFEDSDDDDPTPKTPTQKPTCTTSTPVKQTPPDMNEKLQFSPSTIDKITERLLGSIQKQDLPDPSELLEATSLLREKTPPPPPIIPPKKRKKPDVPYIVGCKDRPKVIRKPSTYFCKGDDDYGVVVSDEDPKDQIPTKRAKKSRIPNYSKSIFNAHSDEIAERLINDDAGDLSDASSDSNKTIEYDPTLIQNPRPHSFSPEPSTSTNSIVIRKNDELFNESLKEINNIDEQITQKSTQKEKEDNVQVTNETTPKKKGDLPTTKKPPLKNEDDLQIIDIPYETIVIEDNCEKNVDIQNTNNAVDAYLIEIFEPSAEVIRPPKDIINNKITNDDDCMIVASSTINNPKNLDEPIIIEDEYSSINIECDNVHNETFEIIDVDNIIAENKSIIDKWKTRRVNELNKINRVVDVATTTSNVTSLQTVTPTTSQAAQDTEIPRTPRPAVIPNTPLQTYKPTSRYNPLLRRDTNYVTLIQSDGKNGTSISECSNYGFQRILNDFFANIEKHSRTITIPNDLESTKVLKRLYRLGSTITTTTHCISVPETPVNTATPISAKSKKSHQTSIPIQPPLPIPTRNIGDCPICLDPLSSSNGIASTICGHIFCLRCIKASVKANRKCPTCRKVLKGVGGGFHQIFL